MMSLYPSMKQGVASCMGWDYSALAGANSPDGSASPSIHRRCSAPIALRGVFLRLQFAINGGCAWETERSAGFLCVRSCTPTYSRLQSCASDVGGSSHIGATPMRHTLTLNPPKARAAAYKAMAFAALHANSSLSVRLARYNAHMTKARSLLGGVQ